jgi:hypothetical protein
VMELIASILILIPRTTAYGALLGLGIMGWWCFEFIVSFYFGGCPIDFVIPFVSKFGLVCVAKIQSFILQHIV